MRIFRQYPSGTKFMQLTADNYEEISEFLGFRPEIYNHPDCPEPNTKYDGIRIEWFGSEVYIPNGRWLFVDEKSGKFITHSDKQPTGFIGHI